MPATALLSLVRRESPESGHERSTRDRPGGKMSSAQVGGTIARDLDDEEQA
ncbi:hypothetical protein [Nonomuraea sp. NPDC002799]